MIYRLSFTGVNITTNCLKTFLMVISPKNKIRLPKFIEIDDHKVTFVTDFKLLGIDDRLLREMEFQE